MANLILNNITIFNNHIKGSPDLFRQFMGFYWDIFDNEKLYPNSLPLTVMNINSRLKYGFSSLIDSQDLKFKQEVIVKLSNDLALKTFLDQAYNGLVPRRLSNTGNDGLINGGREGDEQTVRPINQNQSSSPNNITTNRQALLNFLKDGKEFEDFNFQFRKTVPRAGNVDTFYSDKETKYQYYIQQYEEIATKIPEELLPNYYIFSLAGNSDLLKDVSQKDYNSSLTSGQNSPYTQFLNKFDTLISLDGNLLFTSNFTMNNIESYLLQYSEVYDSVSVDFVQTYKKRFGNLLTAFDSQQIFDKLNANKRYFPMFVDIIFYKNRTSSFFDLLKDANISLSSLQSFILDKVLSKTVDNDTFLQTFFEADEKIFTSGGSLELVTKNHFLMNFDRWFKEYIQNSGNTTSGVGQNHSSLGSERLELNNNNMNQVPLDLIFQNILIDSSKHKYDEIILDNFRTYKNIISGKLSNNEILFFRIEKTDKISGQVIQNFYLPNIPNINIMNYVDTQIKYNKLYSYKIYSVHIVYGTKYKYILKETKDEILLPDPTKEINFNTTESVFNTPLAPGNRNSINKEFKPRPNLFENVKLQEEQSQQFDEGAILIPISNNDEVPFSGNSSDVPKQEAKPTGERFAKKLEPKPVFQNRGGSESNNNSGWSNGHSEPVRQESNSTQDGSGTRGNIDNQVQTNEDEIVFDVIYWPVIKLVEAEYSQEIVTKVIDFPPSLPDISFFPLMETSGSFNVAIQDSSYEYEDYFIPILDEDLMVFTNLIHSGFMSNGQLNVTEEVNKKIKFRGDGDTKEFQVFRTDKEPRSYRDFKLYKTLKYPDESAFLETIEPNKKYYYTFRTKDIHNNISNPTPIYLAEIYNDQLLFIPTFSVFEIKKPSNFEWSKYAKKYIKIAPNIIHKIYNEQNQKLGLGPKNIYGKQFLMRVKSKHTGRVIDIYFKFQLDKNINN